MGFNILQGIEDLGSIETNDAFPFVRADQLQRILERIQDNMNRSVGWADYDDAFTGVPGNEITLLADAWTQLTNDALGPVTTEDELPFGSESFWDTTENRMVMPGHEGGLFLIRFAMSITPVANNTSLSVRLNFDQATPPFRTEQGLPALDEGAGVPYLRKVVLPFFIGDTDVAKGALIEVKVASAAAVATVADFLIARII